MGIPEGDVQADDAAVAPADDARPWNVQVVHQAYDIISHEVIAIRPCVARRSAVAAAVYQDHAIPVRESRNLIGPVLTVSQRAMQEYEGRAVAVGRIMQIDPIYRRFAA